MRKQEFCEHLAHLKRRLITFEGRQYLGQIYDSTARNLVIRASRQVEKSTFLVNTILYEAFTHPGISILFVTPTILQARSFSNDRLLPAIQQSPILRRYLLGSTTRKPNVMDPRFANDSVVHFRAAFRSADAARGLSADLLCIDEVQDVSEGDIPVLQETMSHSLLGRTIACGTPKLIDNHLQMLFQMSTAHEWTIECRACKKGVILDQRCLGPKGTICPTCNTLIDPRQGVWVPRNPGATWGDGFWINHLMVPWINFDQVLDRQRTYDLARFKNECLGLPVALGDHVVTRAELEACCLELPMAADLAHVPPAGQNSLIVGVDWGGGGASRTVLVIGFMRSDYKFQIVRMDRFARDEDPNRVLELVAQRCEDFHVRCIGADGGGNGYVYNRLLLMRLNKQCHLYAILYSMTDQPPHQDGVLWKWTVNRTASIGTVFSRVKKQMLLFPRVQESGSFLDEFACEVAEYDDHSRSIRYSHPETLPDDCLHAANYAMLLGVRAYRPHRPEYGLNE
jgi:hypothetical protein